jgi:hypothetical protein
MPSVQHPTHDLYFGLLLQPEGVVPGQFPESTTVTMCRRCWEELRNPIDQPPSLSLANNMWIGSVPWELSVLTFPEQLLVALVYPRVYVFKLFPKLAHYQPDPSCLQRALRGTVCSYELDVKGAADMVQGKLMPQKPSQLASIVAITFVGKGQLPKNWLRNTFRVRRQVVSDALAWLKVHNPKYYGGIEISDERLQELPEDDIPNEINSIVRHCTETSVLDQEGSGYVPDHDDAEDTSSAMPSGTWPVVTPNLLLTVCVEWEPGVFPIHGCGATDTDLTKMTANELMMSGLSNLWKDGNEGGYAVKHGQVPVSDFGTHKNAAPDWDPSSASTQGNFFEQAFPCLFPCGHGGIEAARQVPVDFREHLQWALQYHDRRFRRHHTFPFVAFSILQKRQTLNSARLQMRRLNFERDARLMETVTGEMLAKAKAEEENHVLTQDPAVRLLKQHVHATAGRVQGSDQSRYQLRSQIWSTSILHGPPYVWLTINPCDLHDPIAQVLAGHSIDLDAFVRTAGPDSKTRAQTIADDPYAAAKFFHVMIRAILETLLQIKASKYQVKNGVGILGEVVAYFGTVESQGRGTLHLHMLLWLKHAPSSDEMAILLQSTEFRARLVAYIEANIRAYLPGLESAESVKEIAVEKDIAYNRPPSSATNREDGDAVNFELRLARAQQVHVCKPRRCLVYDSSQQLKCKRRAPFTVATQGFVNERGDWGPKRLYGYINAWNPAILVNARCNNDIKLLTNGGDTKNITFYVTAYAAKKQGHTHNLSAVLADGYAYHKMHAKPEYESSLRDMHRVLLFRLANALNREQELAAPLVVSYLMGWGDVFRSHSYSPIYWSSFVRQLKKVNGDLSSGHE